MTYQKVTKLMAQNQAPQGILYWFYQDTVIHHSPRLLGLPSAVSISPNIIQISHIILKTT